MSDIQSVKAYRKLVDDLLAKATEAKPDKQIEPPLTEADLGDSIWRVPVDEGFLKTQGQQVYYAAVETAFREKFYDLLVYSAFCASSSCIYHLTVFHVPRPPHLLMTLPSYKYGIFLILFLYSQIMVGS